MRCGMCKDPPQEEMNFCPYCGAQIQEKNEIRIHLGPEETRVSIEIVWDDRECDATAVEENDVAAAEENATTAAGEENDVAAAGEENDVAAAGEENDVAAAEEQNDVTAAEEQKPDEGENMIEVPDEKRRRKYHE